MKFPDNSARQTDSGSAYVPLPIRTGPKKNIRKKIKLRFVIFRPRFEKTLQIPSAGKEKNYKTNRILRLQSVFGALPRRANGYWNFRRKPVNSFRNFLNSSKIFNSFIPHVMKKLLPYLLLFILAGGGISCSDDDPTVPEPEAVMPPHRTSPPTPLQSHGKRSKEPYRTPIPCCIRIPTAQSR